MPCALLCIGPSNIPSNTVLLAVVMHFYTTLLPCCFADAAVIRNYPDNHNYSQNLLCQQTSYWTKVNRTEPNWTEPQTCLACQNHAFLSISRKRMLTTRNKQCFLSSVEFTLFNTSCFTCFPVHSNCMFTFPHLSLWKTAYLINFMPKELSNFCWLTNHLLIPWENFNADMMISSLESEAQVIWWQWQWKDDNYVRFCKHHAGGNYLFYCLRKG